MEKIYKLLPATKSYIWGGKKLFEYGKTSSDATIAESWELSFHKDGVCYIDSGKDKGKQISNVITKEELGENVEKFPFFPILIKLIDARDNLSVQVHPSDDYAIKNENSFGKTEMWYVVEADAGATLYIGLNKNATKEEIKERITNNTILEIMNHIPVKAGDCYFIPSGTLHAIGKGCFICEIQESSNVTYRVFDYGRVDNQGKPRELHIDKALKVINLEKIIPENLSNKNPLVKCNYFTVSHEFGPTSIQENQYSFTSIIVLSGKGTINGMNVKKGDSVFIGVNNKIQVNGRIEFIKTTV